MLELLITYLQATFKNSFPGIVDVMGLAEKIQEQDKEFPAFYCAKDEYKPVSGSENYLYFRQNGNATEEESEDEAVSGCDRYVTRTYPMVAVGYIPKDILNTDNAFIDSKIANNIANILKAANYNSLAPTLQVDEITVEVGAIDTNRYSVWDQEYSGVAFAARFDHVYISVEFDIQISATESCLSNFDCNDMQIALNGDTIIIDFGDQNAWHQTGDVLNLNKKLGSLNPEDWDIIHNDTVIATVKATGININGVLTVIGGVAITGNISASGSGSFQTLAVSGNASITGNETIGGNLTVTGSINYASGAIQSLNGLTGKTQTFATGTTGTDFNIVSAAGVHTFNQPDAGPTSRGAVTTLAQTFVGSKIFELGMADMFRVNANNTQPSGIQIGQSGTANYMMIRGRTAGMSAYAMLIRGDGLETVLNVGATGSLQFGIANVLQGFWNATGFGVGMGSAPTAKFQVRGALNSVAIRVQTSTQADIIVADESAGVRRLAVFGNTPVIRQVVTGSRGGNAALASLLTAFSNFGFITDNTTA